MYYILDENDQILDVLGERAPTQDDVDRAARMFKCSVWVLQGQHTGMSSNQDIAVANAPLDTEGETGV